MATSFLNGPCAARGLHSYRFAHAHGFVMIGAVDDGAAMIEARRSTQAAGELQRWNGAAYVACQTREGVAA